MTAIDKADEAQLLATIDRWIESKSLPAHRVGRLWKFKLSQVDAWIEAGGAAEPDEAKERG